MIEQITLGDLTYNQIGPEFTWRLIHSEGNITFISKMNGYTSTIQDCFESENFKMILGYLLENNLNYQSVIVPNYNNFLEDALIDLDPIEDAYIISFLETFKHENWKLIYNNTEVVNLLTGPYDLYDTDLLVYSSPSLQDCLNLIVNLNLIWNNMETFMEMNPYYDYNELINNDNSEILHLLG